MSSITYWIADPFVISTDDQPPETLPVVSPRAPSHQSGADADEAYRTICASFDKKCMCTASGYRSEG